jgi:drug/metabolite transporter (DMT)-like permease
VFGFFFYQYCTFLALSRIPASMNAVLVSSNVILIVLLSAIFLKERVRPLAILGVFLSLAGVVIVTFNRGFRLGERWDLTGCALSLAAAAAFAFYTVAGKKLLSRNDPLHVATLALFGGAALLLLLCGATIGFQQLQAFSSRTWGLVFLLGVTSIGLAYPFYFSSLKRLPASAVAVFLNLIPVVSVILSLLVLGERFAWPFWLGGVLVLGGVAASNLAGRTGRGKP